MGCAAKQIPEYLLPWSTVNLPKHVNLHLELDKDIGFLFLSYNWALTLNCNSQLWVTALTLSSDSHLWLSALTLSSSSQLWLDSDSQLWLSHSGCLDPKKFFPLLIHPQGSQGCQKITILSAMSLPRTSKDLNSCPLPSFLPSPLRQNLDKNQILTNKSIPM